MSEVVSYGIWYCSECKSNGLQPVKISGQFKNCPECDAPHSATDPYEEWKPADNPEPITDPTELSAALAGPDWNCGRCGQSNSATTDFCSNVQCNQPKDGDDIENAVIEEVWGTRTEGVVSDTSLPTTDHDIALEEVTDGGYPAVANLIARGNKPRRQGRFVYRRGERPQPKPDLTADEMPAVAPWQKWFADLLAGRKDTRRIAAYICVLVAVTILATGAILWLTTEKTYNLTIDELRWKRSVEVEVYKTVQESDWSIPAGARNISTNWEIRSYHKEFSHYETVNYTESVPYTDTESYTYQCGGRSVSNGNGTFSYVSDTCTGIRSVTRYKTVMRSREEARYKDVPDYATKYYFDIDKWTAHKTFISNGVNNDPADPNMPSMSSCDIAPRVIGTLCSNPVRSYYEVALTSDKDRKYTQPVNFVTWLALDPGDSIVGHFRIGGHLISVDWPTGDPAAAKAAA